MKSLVKYLQRSISPKIIYQCSKSLLLYSTRSACNIVKMQSGYFGRLSPPRVNITFLFPQCWDKTVHDWCITSFNRKHLSLKCFWVDLQERDEVTRDKRMWGVGKWFHVRWVGTFCRQGSFRRVVCKSQKTSWRAKKSKSNWIWLLMFSWFCENWLKQNNKMESQGSNLLQLQIEELMKVAAGWNGAIRKLIQEMKYFLQISRNVYNQTWTLERLVFAPKISMQQTLFPSW